MKISKKILTIASLVSMGLCVALLITAIFGVKIFEGVGLKFLLSLATIAVATAFSVNAINFMDKKKIVAYICFALLGLLTLFGLIIYWAEISITNVFAMITSVLAIATIFCNIIISTYLKLEKRYYVLQIITYVLIAIIDIVLSLAIFGISIFVVNGAWQAFCVVCLVTFALLCALSILRRKSFDGETTKEKTITITQAEYDALIKKISELEEENKQLKS